jgi:hypothetical protein
MMNAVGTQEAEAERILEIGKKIATKLKWCIGVFS